MGFGIQLQDEWGGQLEAVGDPKNILHRIFPEPGDSQYPMLGSIDPYADTIFNGLQMNWFLRELAQVMDKARVPEDRELLLNLEKMARRVRDETHLYLKFVGD